MVRLPLEIKDMLPHETMDTFFTNIIYPTNTIHQHTNTGHLTTTKITKLDTEKKIYTKKYIQTTHNLTHPPNLTKIQTQPIKTQTSAQISEFKTYNPQTPNQTTEQTDTTKNNSKHLINFFESYLKKEPIFKDKSVLQATYEPETILHREKEIETVAKVLAPALRGEKPSNLFIYGKTGTGKTLVINHVAKGMIEATEKLSLKVPLKIVYINCKLKKIADTQYRAIAEIARNLGAEIPATGLPTDEVYKKFVKCLEKQEILLILILDEIDQLVSKAGDEILYNLTRLHSELGKSEVSIVGITNNLQFKDMLDARVKSSLSEEELSFHAYSIEQLLSILQNRAKKAFKDGTIGEGVLEKCAAYAGREHGDARRALELLRVAAEISERNDSSKILIEHIDAAEEKIEKDKINDVALGLPVHSQLVLLSILRLSIASKNKPISSGEVYDLYQDICLKAKYSKLTLRRVSDLVEELNVLSIINSKIMSKGRYGRSRQISIGIPHSNAIKLEKLLRENLSL